MLHSRYVGRKISDVLSIGTGLDLSMMYDDERKSSSENVFEFKGYITILVNLLSYMLHTESR